MLVYRSRKVINNDLSPIATFISYIYNNPINVEEFEKEAKGLLEDCKRELGWMYKTNHKIEDLKYRDSKKEIKGDINYIIWSDVFICPNCGNELIFWDIAVDKKEGKIREVFNCCNCNANLKKNDCERVWESFYDERLDKTVTIAKQVPVLINYSIGNKRFEKRPDNEDFELIRKINNSKIPYWYPTDELPVGYNTEQPRRSHGITHVHLFYTKRNLFVLSYLMEKIRKKGNKALAFLVQSYNLTHSTKMSRIIFKKGNNKPILTSHQSGTLYISSLPVEKNLINGILNTKLNIVVNALSKISEKNIVTTQSMTKIENIPDNSIDYIFTDPPFGANINYSELSFIWETWLKVFTNNKPEAIINPVQKKDLTDYQNLMTESIKEYYRVLKPGRWITVEFSNTKSSVWNAIQDGLQRAGFVIANVSALDKKQGSFKAVTTTTAVKQDLIISAYKPRQDTIEKIEQTKNTEDSVWTFVTQHLQQLPVFEGQKGEAKLIAERTPRILFDRMVAYFVQKGLPVPMSSGDFQVEVAQRYPMRDGMIFLESQVAEYDKKRISVKEFTQLSLFVSDENSAIEWIRQQLMNKPQTRQDLHPEFMKQIQHIAKHEELPELDDLLEQNFLRYDGEEPVPNQILTYLRRNYKDLRGLEPTNPSVIEKAIHRWYVPDPNKQSDLEKLREKALLREFDDYVKELEGSKKKLRTFRTEAVRAGFKNAYKEKNFETIVKVGDRIPEKVIQEDDKLFMFYENAKIRLGL